MKDRRERHLAQKNFVELIKQLEARGIVRGAFGLRENAIVFRVAPAGEILAAIGADVLQVIMRIRHGPDPAGAGDLIISGPHGVKINLPFLVHERDVDAQLALPHLLYRLANRAVLLARVEEQFELGKSLAAGKTRLGQQAPRFVAVLPQDRARDISARAGGGEFKGRFLRGPRDIVDDRLAIDRHRQRPADPRIIQRRLAHVEIEIVGAVVFDDAQELRVVVAIQVELGQRNIVGRVQLAGAKHALLRVLAVHAEEPDLLQAGIRPVPIVRIRHHGDDLIGFPLLEHEGTVGNQIARFRPRRVRPIEGAEFFNRGLVHRQQGKSGQHARKKRRWRTQPEFEGERIDCADANLGEVRDLALQIFRGVFEVKSVVGKVRAELLAEQPPEGIHPVARGHRIAVRPFCVGSQMKGVDEAVRRDFPAGRRRGSRCQIDGVEQD